MSFDKTTTEPSRIGDYAVGSLESRAAARLLLARRRISGLRFEVIFCCEDWIAEPSATEWAKEGPNGQLSRIVRFPGGASMEESLRRLGGYSEAEIRAAVEQCPVLPDHFEMMTCER